MKLPTQLLYINGEYRPASSGQTFVTINPANGEVLADVQIASKEDVDYAVDCAVVAQKKWASMTAVQRSRILNNAVAILRERNDELALLETLDTGKPISETAYVDIATGADVIEYYAGLAASIEGTQIPLRDTSFVYTRREPLGVIASIGAWNYPIQIAMWKLAPALAAGNAVVYKASETTPLTTLKLAEVLTEAGLPAGVFNVVNGSGRAIGDLLTQHPKIAKVSFTGGSATGKKVCTNAISSSLKEVTMELGGKSPLVICDDADLDLAADIAVMANFYSSGQVCTNGTRVFVPASIKPLFEEKVLERVKRFRVGDPQDSNTNFGPLVGQAHMDNVLHYIELGKKEGATCLIGGQRDQRFPNGCYVEATVFTDCRDDMTIVKEEIFGPVMSILSYETEEEVIQRANDTEYGLAAGVVTKDLNKAHRIIHQLEAGICWINTWGESDAKMPVGGYKLSGIGRENGIETLKHYTQTKSIQVELGRFNSVF